MTHSEFSAGHQELSRRGFAALSTGAMLASMGCSSRGAPASPRLNEIRAGGADITLTAQRRATRIAGVDQIDTWAYGESLFPVLRAQKGEKIRVTLRNALPQHTSIHWHGVRVPNAMDGVPYLTQHPVQAGAEFTYSFTPPDAGTFFFHPHCNTAEQLGRGLAGALIVEDSADAGFDDDLVLFLKDWRVKGKGVFEPFLTLSGASRSGSFGHIRTINGHIAPNFELDRGTRTRIRLINADSSRICSIGVIGARASLFAIDGNAFPHAPLESWRLGPGMRIDLALESIFDREIFLVDYFADAPVTLATFVPRGGGTTSGGNYSMPRPPLAPDLSLAWKHTLQLGTGVTAANIAELAPVILPTGEQIGFADSLCLSSENFWTLDGQAWPVRDHRRLPPPLFTFKRGQTVVLELQNTTSRAHPIHIHGHTMTVLSASVLPRPMHRADTVLVLPNEQVKVAFVADNPGKWMIHCHIIEHQETGMMGWFRVS